MCEFISWIEKDKKVYFLTGKQVFHSPKGEALQKWCQSKDDLIGHGAIRWFYELEERDGDNKECADFSTPKNFPIVVVKAIKRDDMRGFGSVPDGLLQKPLDDKYWADRKPLDDKYWADRNSLADKYWADRNSLADKYAADRKPLDDKYAADRKPLDDKYWDLFSDTENRSPAWR